MRHRNTKKRLGRKRNHRKAMVGNLCTAVILHERIETTETRAKVIQPLVEKLISTAKSKNEREAIREIQKMLSQKEASIKVMKELKERYKNRSSGFTRITPIGVRNGDAAPLVCIELLSEK